MLSDLKVNNIVRPSDRVCVENITKLCEISRKSHYMNVVETGLLYYTKICTIFLVRV